ncbi:hypothetical protein [Goodfellowiella coeruleoviolacea]|uniref:hypothetical protein n=1 Tax=Goodfellowiella coeruleoviolacea TaxID=334858 RepID=UPI0020A475D0|nr:hypothetical protein [Goodfellowiella coeruleoviolacea]
MDESHNHARAQRRHPGRGGVPRPRFLRYAWRWWRSRRDYDDPTWLLFTALAMWLFVLWLICFFPH